MRWDPQIAVALVCGPLPGDPDPPTEAELRATWAVARGHLLKNSPRPDAVWGLRFDTPGGDDGGPLLHTIDHDLEETTSP